MTPSERAAELQYRIEERLALLCGSNKPTQEQIDQAKHEAAKDLHKIERNYDERTNR